MIFATPSPRLITWGKNRVALARLAWHLFKGITQGNNMTKPINKPAQPKVQAIKTVLHAIEPSEGWTLQSNFGFMAFDNTDAGRLVRLADVLRWLAYSRAVPRIKALDLLCDAITPDTVNAIYWTHPTAYAGKTMTDSHGRERLTLEQIGISEFVSYMRKIWSLKTLNPQSKVDVLDDGSTSPLVNCSIRIDKANELWGYGQITETQAPKIAAPATYAELVNARKLNPGNPWTDAMVALMAAEIDARSGQTGIRKGIAKQLDISVPRIGQLLKRKTKRQPASGGNGTSRVLSFGGGKN